jgi:hypothetical protein
MNDLILSKLKVGQLDGNGACIASGFRRPTDTSALTADGGSTITLSVAQSGTLFEVDGTGNNVVNMPALNTANAGLMYEFLLTSAVGGGTTTTFVLPGSGVSIFHAHLVLTGNASTCAETYDVAGDTLTLVNSTVVGARVLLTCLKDDGTNSTWKADVISSPVATVD